jgi:autotransporter strand-loop-strand O-heptosyltransferase
VNAVKQPDANRGEELGANASQSVDGEAAATPVVTPAAPPARAAAGALPASVSKAAYPSPAAEPTQLAAEGLRFDFNDGCRVSLPTRQSGSWRVRLQDLDTGNVLFESENKGARINSSKRWYVRFRVDVWTIEENSPDSPRLVLSHDYDTADREVLIQFPIGTLGDTLGWFSYCEQFAKAHPNCRVTVALSGFIIPLLRGAYPNLTLLTHVEAVEQKVAERAYATYSMGLFFDDVHCDRQPIDFRHVGLHRSAGYILGVDPTEEAPRLALPDESRPISEPYVCIAVQATSAAKTWTNPNGWREVITFLKSHGYRVICVDQKPVHGTGIMWTHLPHGAEDMTGIPLAEAARWLRHAEFFVGLSSGLSWLAWAAGATVVMISGYSLPSTEFNTPYRIINWHTCNGCWSDPQLRFNHSDYLWCPRHAGTPRQFECTRLITSTHVTQVIQKIPGFGEHQSRAGKAAIRIVLSNDSNKVAAQT